MSSAKARPTVSRATLEAFESQSGLQDVSRFLIETGRVTVNDRASGPGMEMNHEVAARS